MLDQQNSLVYLSERKHLWIAYILLIFLGAFGIHRFYIGNNKIGFIELLSTIIATTTFFINPEISIIFMILICICLLVDLFVIPSTIKWQNYNLLKRLNLAGTGFDTVSLRGKLQ